MRSTELDLTRYPTDKVRSGYLDQYDRMIGSLAHEEITLLEIGVFRGGSLLLWRDSFSRAKIVGIDLNLPDDLTLGERIHVFKGSQTDAPFLKEVARQTAPDGFDIVIDDDSHFGKTTRTTFWYLFDNHLKPGGWYVIEDWGTGYWDDWPDGRSIRPRPTLLSRFARLLGVGKNRFPSHDFGTVGFVKQLVDEQGAHDALRPNMKAKPRRPSKFESLTILPSIAFIRKRKA